MELILSQPENQVLNQITIKQIDSQECVSHDPSDPSTGILCFLLVVIALATAGGNFLVIFAVLLVKKLRTPSNILIVSLAFSDFFVALLVLPFTIIDALKGYWPFNEGLCDMYISFDVLLCTSSILNLCAISIDRYLLITRPLTYASRRTPCRMAGMIAAAWIGSALISIPPNFGWKEPFTNCFCEYSRDVGYQIYATFCAFYLPLIVMIVLYGKIFILAREKSRGEQSILTVATTQNKSCKFQPEHTMHESKPVLSEMKEAKNSETITRDDSKNDADADVNRCTGDKKEKQIISPSNESHIVLCKGGDRLNSNSSRKLLTEKSTSADLGNDLQRRKLRGNSETKVIKTLGVIMGCFCLCWLPFFIVQLLRALLSSLGYDTQNMVSLNVFRFLQWLGYVNSFLNPIIYAKFDREFRLPFKMILLCQCRNINARLRAAQYTAQYGLFDSNRRRSVTFNHVLNTNFNRFTRWFTYSNAQRSETAVSRPRPRKYLDKPIRTNR